MVKHIDIKEFREQGYLQELNRLFLHPLGLALEVVQEDDGSEHLGGIWDYREDSEGIYYDLDHADEDRKKEFREKAERIAEIFKNKAAERYDKLGFIVEGVE